MLGHKPGKVSGRQNECDLLPVTKNLSAAVDRGKFFRERDATRRAACSHF
jgi:hypothetical protein